VQEKTNDAGPATNEIGQTATEYALVLMLVSIAAAVGLVALNHPFGGLVTRIVNSIASLV
jgi:Flp pilus assembly pilin Flp